MAKSAFKSIDKALQARANANVPRANKDQRVSPVSTKQPHIALLKPQGRSAPVTPRIPRKGKQYPGS